MADILFQSPVFRNLAIQNRIVRSYISGRFNNYDGSGNQARINWEMKFARIAELRNDRSRGSVIRGPIQRDDCNAVSIARRMVANKTWRRCFRRDSIVRRSLARTATRA
jgi:2,4-dienoyl-CoA reductase-like NADH-dependent reductase (Old Yellow Enzyme family)